MALIDCDWWLVRRKLKGAAGASQVSSSAPSPIYEKRVPYIRRCPSGCNSNSRRQCETRARWNYITAAWKRVLTDNERYYWNEWAKEEDFWWRDEEFQRRHLSGYEWFCAVNGRTQAAGLPLVTYAGDLWWGISLSLLEIDLVTSTRIRVTFEPDEENYNVLAVYGRGPMSPGCHAVVPDEEWWRDSVPSRWKLIGFSERGAASPVEMDLPFAVASGRKLAVMACQMDYTGLMAEDWLVEELVA
jgi:hypothetical protein